MVEQHYITRKKAAKSPCPQKLISLQPFVELTCATERPPALPTSTLSLCMILGEFLLDSTVVRSFRAQLAPGFLNLSFLLLFWVFISASILGLALEDVFHVLVYGGYESRAGFVWGPFLRFMAWGQWL